MSFRAGARTGVGIRSQGKSIRIATPVCGPVRNDTCAEFHSFSDYSFSGKKIFAIMPLKMLLNRNRVPKMENSSVTRGLPGSV